MFHFRSHSRELVAGRFVRQVGGCLVLLLVCLLGPLGSVSTLYGGDWPQLLGPERQGVAEQEVLLTKWPGKGPEVRWSHPLGMGYAGPAAVGRQVFIFHRVNDQERVEALDAATGKLIWKTDYPARYRGGFDADSGPRCVPLVQQGVIYVLGAAGELHALRSEDGKKLWSRDLYGDYDGRDGYFGAGSGPIVVGKKLLVNVGGRDDAGLVALDTADGKIAWKGTREAASYSSPATLKRDGKTEVVFVTRMNVVAVDPASGKESFRFPFGKTGPTVNAATPLTFGRYLFVTSSYQVGGKLYDVASGTSLWANDETLSSQYTTPVHHEGFLYGTHGREDIGRAAFRCVEARTGKVRWSEENLGVTHVIRAGDQLLLLTVGGRLMVAEANPERFTIKAEAKVTNDAARALPALAHGRLLFRTNVGRGGGGKLVCLQVGAE